MTILEAFPDIRGIILDMDGVLWRGNQPLGNLPDLFRRMKDQGFRVTLATNNSTRTIEEYHQRMASFGVDLEPWQIVNSAQAVGFYLRQKYPQGGLVYVVGEQSLIETLREYGFEPEDQKRDVLAVVAGMDRGLNFEKLTHGTVLIRSGAPFVATNPDRTFPTPEGLIPGTGAVLAALEAATDIKPIIAGKPSPMLFTLAMERMGTRPEETLTIGDRLETDIAGGQAIGCRTALVLSGVTTPVQAGLWQPPPDMIAPDLTALLVG